MRIFGRKSDIIPSPNIWQWTDVYERENQAQDPDELIWRTIAKHCSWDDAVVLDVGCGSGYHLPHFARTASMVHGVEPHPPLQIAAVDRTSSERSINVLLGSAERLPLANDSVDVVHSRTAYFFGPGCEPGLAEASRVLRPGGWHVIVDLDASFPGYGDWMRADIPKYDPAEIEDFFANAGFACEKVSTVWRFDDRKTLAEVLRIEFSKAVANRALTAIPGLEIPVGYRVRVRQQPTGIII